MFHTFAQWLLKSSEEVFLTIYGWKKVKQTFGQWVDTHWIPPDTYYWEKKIGQEHSHGHAVNSQKAACEKERKNKLWAKINDYKHQDDEEEDE